MSVFERVAERLIKDNRIENDDRIVLGLSGGGDSVALLLVLLELRKELQLSIRAVHVHHCIRGEAADGDQSFVEELCRENDIELVAERYDIPKLAEELGISTELAGRKARKEAFEKQLRQMGAGAKLLLAHHANDQEETILMNFLRGSGITGLTGMREVQRVRLEDGFEYVTIRPFLNETHQELLEGLRDASQSWREDETNSENIYRRNKFRLEILPELKAMYPGLTEVLVRNANIIGDCDEYIKLKAEEFVEKHAVRADSKISISIEALKKEHIALQREAIRCAINSLGGLVDVSFAQMEDIISLLYAQSGKGIIVRGRSVRRSFDSLIISCGEEKYESKLRLEYTEISAGEILKKIREKSYKGYEKWFDCDKIEVVTRAEIVVRKPEEDDYLVVDKEGHTKKLSVYLKQQKVDTAIRKDISVVAAGSLILAVEGYRDSCGFEVEETSKKILRVYMEG